MDMLKVSGPGSLVFFLLFVSRLWKLRGKGLPLRRALGDGAQTWLGVCPQLFPGQGKECGGGGGDGQVAAVLLVQGEPQAGPQVTLEHH